MLRLLLLLVLIVFAARAFWQLVDGVMTGVSGPRRGAAALPGVSMVRDPVCGTFVLPEGSVSITEGARRVHFCSTACRDAYHSRRVRPA
jgi:hypothetical protein